MSPKNIYSILKNFIEVIPVSLLENLQVIVDGNAMAYFALMNARKKYHEDTFCIEAAQKAAKNLQLHEKEVGKFSTNFCINCFETLASIIPNYTIVFDGKDIPLEKEKEFGRRNKDLSQRLKLLANDLDTFEKDFSNEQKAKKFYNSLAHCHTFDIKILKKFIENTPNCIVAQGEADCYCAKACVSGKYQAVLSPDYDVLMYRCPFLIRDITDKTASVILLDTVLENLDITFSQFVDMGILMGNDYNDRIYRIGPKKSLQLIKKHGSLENIELNLRINLECINWKRLREIFQ